ncbi:MAG: hypothetical protein ACE5Q6_17825 [Dehalococcoidia bacterium]
MRGHVYQRSKGSWTIVYDLLPDGSGKRRQKSETFKATTKKQAEQKLRERLAALENGVYVQKRKETLAEFLQSWLESYAATHTSPRTVQGYRGNVNSTLSPAWVVSRYRALPPATFKSYIDGC